MAKKKLQCEIGSYGIYTKFDSQSKQLPKIQEFTTEIPAVVGIEFGFILEISKGKGEKMEFKIDHPPFNNSQGQVAPPFEGEFYVRNNYYEFFLGDTIWEPVEDKVGPWRLRIFHNRAAVADKTFDIVPV